MARLTNFGQLFAPKVLEKTYQNAIVDSITNRNYEGEIKKPGDRVNILSFLNSIVLSDYTVGTDMNSQALVDANDQLVVEKRRYWNFALDRLEDQFTYADDIVENITNDAAKQLEKEVDTYILDRAAGGVKAGNWIGVNLVVNGSGQRWPPSLPLQLAVRLPSTETTTQQLPFLVLKTQLTGSTTTVVSRTRTSARASASVRLHRSSLRGIAFPQSLTRQSHSHRVG
jgi:hypothetical protein